MHTIYDYYDVFHLLLSQFFICIFLLIFLLSLIHFSLCWLEIYITISIYLVVILKTYLCIFNLNLKLNNLAYFWNI